MIQKINSVLLLDDNEADNYLHRLLINRAGIANEVMAIQSPRQALDYLNNKAEQQALPDLILLDLNMPGLNGWEFIEEYKKLDIHKTDATVIIVLTTSFNPDDEQKAREISEVSDFYKKPLTHQKIDEIYQEYFNS